MVVAVGPAGVVAVGVAEVVAWAVSGGGWLGVGPAVA